MPMFDRSIILLRLLGTVCVLSAPQYSDEFNLVSGAGDPELLGLISYARRSLGEVSATEAEYQTMPMLYNGDQDGLLEGPTWGAYWTQNSYGTSLTTISFLDDVTFKGIRESQNW